MRWRCIILSCGILPLFFLNACAFKRLIFNNLDWLAVYQLDGYLDLSSAQEKSIKKPVQETVTWLKAKRLPAIIDFFQGIQTVVRSRKVEAKTYEAWLKQLAILREEVTVRITPPLALLLQDLDAEQIEHLNRKLSKSEKRLVQLLDEDDEDFPEALADYTDHAAEAYAFWFGKLRSDQKAMLVDKLGWTRSGLSQQLQQRQRFRGYWTGLLQSHDGAALARALQQSARPDGSWDDPAYLRLRRDQQRRFQDFFLALFASLDPKQWRHVEEAIQDILESLQALPLTERT